MNFKLPQQDDDFDYYGNSSQDESRGSQGTLSFKLCIFFALNYESLLSFVLVDSLLLHKITLSSCKLLIRRALLILMVI